MQIDSHTPQAALEQLYHAVTRRELLKESPLNIRRTLSFALLFLLFPGMALGFWAGLGITLVFCVGLIALLGANHTPEAVLAAQVWLACGCCVFVVACVLAVISARDKRRLQETPRPAAAAGGGAPLACSVAQPLRWRKDSDVSWGAQLTFLAPAAGIYAFVLSVQNMQRRQLLTLGNQGMCTVYTSTSAAGDLQALLLFKLAVGSHTLRWSLLPRSGRPSPAQVTLLCAPQVNPEKNDEQ